MKNIKKILSILIACAFIVSMISAASVLAFGENYPSSVLEYGLPEPSEGHIMMGTIIGSEEGWGNNFAHGRYSMFDGWTDTFFDTRALGDPDCYAGIMMDEAYILTEIRIFPREGFLGRFRGMSIWGFDGESFDISTATLIWESEEGAEELEWQIIPASEFFEGRNTGFTSFAFFNELEHGSIAELELWGHPAAGPAEVAPEPTPPPVEEEAPPVEEPPADEPAPPAEPAPAPPTFDPIALIAIGAITSAAGVVIMKKRKCNE